ncbi:MAG: class I SAM-dependent methyltransferase [Thermocladium sp.]
MRRTRVIEYYDNLSRSYLDLYGSDAARKYVAALDFLKRGARVLDLGCGAGVGAGYLEGGFLYVGLDISMGMLRLAKLWGVDLVCGDGGMLPFRDSAFDVVMLINIVDSDADADVLFEARRVGGLLLGESPRDKDNEFLRRMGITVLERQMIF